MIRTRLSVVNGTLRPVMGSKGSAPASVRTQRADFLSTLAPAPSQAQQAAAQRVTASMGPSFSSAPMQVINTGGVTWNRFLTGLTPEDDQGLIPYYRDCYDFDSVAGATVDMQSTFPFSDYTLVGIDADKLDPYREVCENLNVRSLMAEVALNYMVDGAFVGTLVHDARTNKFRDIMVHDWAACSIKPSPFYSADPSITLSYSHRFSEYMSSTSPYVKHILKEYPESFIRAFQRGMVELDPLLTVFIPRRGTQDKASTSYLRRIFPMYLLEKTLYRGTLVEAQKRMRATSHIVAGTDTWEPTPNEMQAILGQFQMSEMDPLGAWIVTRQGVQVQDIRPGGDFWKWTDLIDTLVPYKLRGLGVSEAYLSGDVSYAAAETAMSSFTENLAAIREYLTIKLFTQKLFPLIAVTNKLYKDISKAARGTTHQAFLHNLRNRENLYIPEVRWHKTLDNHDPGMMDMLEKLGEKGIPVPLKMWAAAANVSLDMLLGDLKDDEKIREAVEKITGQPVDTTVNDGGDGGDGGMGEFASMKQALTRVGSDRAQHRRKPLLARNFVYRDGTPMDEPIRTSKSGNKVHSVYNTKAAKSKVNDAIITAARRLHANRQGKDAPRHKTNLHNIRGV